MGPEDRGVLWLTSSDLSEALSWPEIVDAVDESYALIGRGEVANPPRVQVREDGAHTALHIMPALSEAAGLASLHVYSAGNRGLPVAQKVTLVFGMADGALRAVIESDWLSSVRTGATGAVATRHLARPDARTLGIIGSGKQARAQLLAIAATRSLAMAYVYSPTFERRTAYAEDMNRQTGITVVALDTADAVIEHSDIVSTATASSLPVFSSAAVRPGLHINAIGAHSVDRREIDGPTVARSRIFVDDVERSRLEDGELRLAIRESAITRSHPVTALAEVVAGRVASRSSPADVTLFLSGGLGSEYLGVAAAAVARAEALGLGQRVRF